MDVAPDAEVDPEAALDRLIEAGAVDEAADGALTTTEAFEDVRGIYRDTYGDADDEAFERTLADVFDVDVETAAAYVEANEVRRADLVAYLSVQSFLDDPPDRATLAVMADMVAELGPGSPVPEALPELDDESYAAFIDEHPDAMLTVWTHDCAPCRAMKEDLDAILDRLPGGVAAAGLDGEAVSRFRLEFGVDSAPTVLLFRDGDLAETITGRRSPVALADRFADVYGEGGNGADDGGGTGDTEDADEAGGTE